eukprot:TRINITY_DN8204_c0_g11_i1.p1 TRINITY_DN8204_c0_g11~~TRINITY_DN8204_c0_g11_i1.p1  ORF type:complete len:343 (+),score=87.33 TRINITY_DN8204_c0_g11_i1:59-1030(+)
MAVPADAIHVKYVLSARGVVLERRRGRLPRGAALGDVQRAVVQFGRGEAAALKYTDEDGDAVLVETEEDWEECRRMWAQSPSVLVVDVDIDVDARRDPHRGVAVPAPLFMKVEEGPCEVRDTVARPLDDTLGGVVTAAVLRKDFHAAASVDFLDGIVTMTLAPSTADAWDAHNITWRVEIVNATGAVLFTEADTLPVAALRVCRELTFYTDAVLRGRGCAVVFRVHVAPITAVPPPSSPRAITADEAARLHPRYQLTDTYDLWYPHAVPAPAVSEDERPTIYEPCGCAELEWMLAGRRAARHGRVFSARDAQDAMAERATSAF